MTQCSHSRRVWYDKPQHSSTQLGRIDDYCDSELAVETRLEIKKSRRMRTHAPASFATSSCGRSGCHDRPARFEPHGATVPIEIEPISKRSPARESVGLERDLGFRSPARQESACSRLSARRGRAGRAESPAAVPPNRAGQDAQPLVDKRPDVRPPGRRGGMARSPRAVTGILRLAVPYDGPEG